MCSHVAMTVTTTSQVLMTPKKDNVYAKRVKSKLVATSLKLLNEVIDNDKDQPYVPTGTTTPTKLVRDSREAFGRRFLT